MSKNKSQDPSEAEDYLTRLQWRSNHADRHTPWYLIPRWKYKSVSRVEHEDPSFLISLALGIFMFLVVGLIYSSVVYHSGLAIFILIAVLIIAMILFFAMYDAKNNFKDDD